MWCVGENPSHALLWPHKETVFRVRQCGDAWHVGVKLPVKPTETGMGHEQQHTWRVSLCFLTVSALSVCVGWRWTWWMCVCNCIFGNLMIQNSISTWTRGAPFMEACQWVWASTNPPSYPRSISHSHAHTHSTYRHSFLHTWTQHTLTTTYGIGFNPLFSLSKTRSYRQPMMDASVNWGYIISNS